MAATTAGGGVPWLISSGVGLGLLFAVIFVLLTLYFALASRSDDEA